MYAKKNQFCFKLNCFLKIKDVIGKEQFLKFFFPKSTEQKTLKKKRLKQENCPYSCRNFNKSCLKCLVSTVLIFLFSSSRFT